MSETVYIETSIIGYLSARTSNNLILMANVEATREWWEHCRSQFTLYISQVVLDEVRSPLRIMISIKKHNKQSRISKHNEK